MFHWSFESKPKPKADSYWQHYLEGVNRVDGKPYALCKHCGSIFIHPRQNGSPRAVTRHIQHYCAKAKRLQGPLDRFTKRSDGADANKTTQSTIEELVLKFFISGNIAFAQAENTYLRDIIKLIPLDSGSRSSCPTGKVLRVRLREHGEVSINELQELLDRNDSKVSLALDCWSSRSNYGFIGMHHFHAIVAAIIALLHDCSTNGRYESSFNVKR
jgi:hypothetical protein